MRLTLLRKKLGPLATLGELYVDGVRQCETLEDTVRAPGVKVPGATAIPAGTYKVIVNWSPHFDRQLPELVGVPNFIGIRIHPGNTPADTEGCILVGTSVVNDHTIAASRAAFELLWPKIQAAAADCSIEIINPERNPSCRSSC